MAMARAPKCTFASFFERDRAWHFHRHTACFIAMQMNGSVRTQDRIRPGSSPLPVLTPKPQQTRSSAFPIGR